MDQDKKIAIIVPITRAWALHKLFYNLEQLICEPKNVSLFMYIDTNNPEVKRECREYAKTSKFSQVITKISNNGPTYEVRIAKRRDRIVECHQVLQKLLWNMGFDYIFGVEDDTLFGSDTLQKLLEPMSIPDVGYVEGVQVGRWGVKMIGAWLVDDVENPKRIKTIEPLEVNGVKQRNVHHLENIDAGGFYCFVTRADLYLSHKFEWHDDCFGPDVLFGIGMRKKGFKCLIDWRVNCGHDVKTDVLWPSDGKIEVAEYNKVNGEWKRQDRVSEISKQHI